MSASASSRCPFPSTPATPRISPLRTSNEIPFSLPSPVSSWTPRPGSPPPPAAKHRDPVGDLENLVELVADEHDRLARVAQLPQVAEQLLGLPRREHGGGLVQD